MRRVVIGCGPLGWLRGGELLIPSQFPTVTIAPKSRTPCLRKIQQAAGKPHSNYSQEAIPYLCQNRGSPPTLSHIFLDHNSNLASDFSGKQRRHHTHSLVPGGKGFSKYAWRIEQLLGRAGARSPPPPLDPPPWTGHPTPHPIPHVLYLHDLRNERFKLHTETS